MLENFRKWAANKLSPPSASPKNAQRSYAGAQWSRLTADWVAQSTSIDSEVLTSLRTLRNRTRQLVRDNDYTRNAIRLIKNNLIGQGINFQGQVMMARGGKLDEAANDAIEATWKRWCRASSCSTNGKYSFTDIEKLIASNVPESGEILIRMIKNTKFGDSKIPFALEIIEADQLVDNLSVGRGENGNQIKMGIEMDGWGRPVAYHLFPHHPGDYNFAGQPQANRYIRVPAEEIIHLGISERPNQTRFVPWFVSALRSINDMDGYEEAEIVAARASANVMGIVQSPEDASAFAAESNSGTGEFQTELAPGQIMKLYPGETFSGFTPSRPNAAMDPFIRYLLRKMAAGIGVSYESLSRDYSQSNYSSSRLALLDDRDNWRGLQKWLIESFHQRVYECWLNMAVGCGELPFPLYWSQPERYQAVRWKPRGWSWIDPLKEVMAAKLSVRSGFETLTDTLAEKGKDIEDQYKTRRRELDMAADYQLVFESDPAQVNIKGDLQPIAAPQETDTGATEADDGSDSERRLVRLYSAMERALNNEQTRVAAHLLDEIETLEQHR